jgi:nitrile hydratase subunit beta
MAERPGYVPASLPNIVKAEGEEPLFRVDDNVKIATRFPIGQFRAPNYIRGKRGRVEVVIEPRAVNNGDERFGRNVGEKNDTTTE